MRVPLGEPMYKDVLKEIGLTDAEIKVYLALLSFGDSTRSALVHKTSISGSKIYDVLDRLAKKGLVSIYIKDKVKHFKSVHPDQILSYIEDKKNNLKKLEKEAKLILPSLFQEFSSHNDSNEVELLSGLKGLEVLFRDQIRLLKKGETCYVIGGTKGSDETSLVAFFKKIHFMREKKGIVTKMLYNLNQKSIVGSAYSTKEYSRTSTRFITHSSPVAINIYKDHVVIIIFGKSTNAIHVQSQEVSNSFMEYFELLWKQSSI